MCVKCFQNANLVICTSTTYMIYNSNIHHTIILNIIASNSYLTEYVNTTYEGHYTSDQGDNVQTLDIIESVGDAKSFCRSNAIKYLTRYEKKGQAKRDILKAAHYCLLLYYFDGHTN